MSGGSFNYAYRNVEDFADRLREAAREWGDSPLWLEFASFLDDVAVAMHNIEWVVSYDYSLRDEVKSINTVLNRAVPERYNE